MANSDVFTISALLILVMGAVCFYLYTRIKQTEKKLALVEGILLDLKTATEASFLDFPAATSYMLTKDLGDDTFNGMEAEDEDEDEDDDGGIEGGDDFPFEAEESSGNEQDIGTVNVTKSDNTMTVTEESTPAAEPPTKVQIHDIDLELMNVKELIAVARSKGLTVSKTMRKQQIIDAINAATVTVAATANVEEPIEEVSPDGFATESSLLTGSSLGSAPF
jgi:hypothetical protein